MIIVTGGAGLIGSGIVWGLNKSGTDDILIVDHLGESEKWKNLRALKYLDYVEKDQFPELLEKNPSLKKAEALIHMGACSATTESDASYLVENNYRYSRNLALFCVENKIKFLYASSAATYGDGSKGYKDDEDAIGDLRPLNMYGYSKQMFDLWAKRSGILGQITGLKFTNVYGPNELHKAGMRSMVCRAFEQISDSGKVKLFKSYKDEYKDGEQKRDFLYIKDAVKMVLFLLEKSPGGIFNIGSGRAETWNSLAEAVFRAMDANVNIEYVDMPEHLKGKYQYYTKAEMGKLHSAGYTESPGSLEDSISDYVKNYLIPEKYLGDE